MATEADLQAHTEEVPSHDEAHEPAGPMAVSTGMVVWTWITFGLMAFVLYKYAWKPILAGLDSREQSIRRSIDEADEIHRQMEGLESTREAKIAEADDEAKGIVARSRKAAVEAGRVIEDKAKDEAKILLDNAKREIRASEEKAEHGLKRTSAELAVALAEKILRNNLDEKKQKALADELIKDL